MSSVSYSGLFKTIESQLSTVDEKEEDVVVAVKKDKHAS